MLLISFDYNDTHFDVEDNQVSSFDLVSTNSSIILTLYDYPFPETESSINNVVIHLESDFVYNEEYMFINSKDNTCKIIILKNFGGQDGKR